MTAAISRRVALAMLTASAFPCFVEAARSGSSATSDQAKPLRVIVNIPQKTGKWLHRRVVANLGYDPLYRGTADERLKDAWRQIKESGALFYVRCHNVFSDSDYGCRIYSEDGSGKPLYDWTFLDEVLDIILGAGMRPIIECDFMPDALADGEIVRNYGGGAINLPKDFGKWKTLVCELVRHCEKRYGREEVRKWFFEVWNEPDVSKYWVGGGRPMKYENIVRFFKLYDYFAAGAKEADPHVSIGGPALGGCNIDYSFARYFLRHCARGENFATGRKEGAPIDFISWHAYGELDYILDVNEKYSRIIEEEASSLSKCRRHLNEWGQRLGEGGNWPCTHNHYEAAFTCALLREVLASKSAKVDLMLRWGGLTGDYFSGWRSLFTRIGDKTVPVSLFNFYRVLGKMSSGRVKTTLNPSDRSTGAIATSAAPNRVQILLWRFDEKNDVSTGPERKFTVTVRGFQRHIRTVRSWHYLIDREHCDAWSAWRRIGGPKPASPGQAEAIFREAVLSIAGEKRNIPVRREQAIITLTLHPNSVCLLVLGKEGNPTEGGPPIKPPPPDIRLPKPLLP